MLTLLLTLIISAFVGYRLYKSLLSPMFMFNMIWLITLLLYEMKWSEIQQDLNDKCILCIWCAIMSFNIGVCFAKTFSYIRIKNIFSILRLKQHLPWEKKIYFINAFIVLMIIIEGIYSKGYPLIWLLLQNGKSYKDFGIPSVTGALYGLIVCMGAYTLFKKSSLKYFYLLIGILVVSRQIIMSIVIEGIIVYCFQNKQRIKHVDRKKVVILIIVAFIFFGVYGNIRTGENAFNAVFEARELYEKVPSIFKWAYAYICFAINNFNNLVSITDGGVNGGASMLNELLPTVLLEQFGVSNLYEPYYLVKVNFTTSTYLPPIYLDFGLAGIVLFNFVIGFWGERLYRKYIKEPSVKNSLGYAVYIHNILLLLFSNFFLYLPIIIQYFYIWVFFNNEDSEINGGII